MAHSSIVGGSNAGRLINCPGSYQATLALPPAAERSSEYAEEGTAMHEVMAKLFDNRLKGGAAPAHQARQWLGLRFHDRALTQTYLDELILPALQALEALEALHGGGFEIEAIERSVQFPGIPGAFGTCDLILRSDDTVIIVDWKFGGGVYVPAVYKVAGGEVTNPQLMFYLTAAMSSARHIFRGAKKLVLAIIQPRSDAPLSHTLVTRKEIKWFKEDLQNAVAIATDRNPPRTKGEWCRFAPCKIDCPLWTGPVLDLTALGVVPRTEPVAREVTSYAEYLARAKALVDIFEMFSKEVNEQLHAYLEDGGMVPGWKLKAKVKQRKWLDDEEHVAGELIKLGFAVDEIWEERLRTFKDTNATAKKRGVKIPDHLRVAPETAETTVCPESDPAPKIEPALAVEQFRASLKLLKSSS